MAYYICHCMSLHVCLGAFFFFFFFLDSRLAIFWDETLLLAFCLWCFDCGAVTLSASFFPLVSWKEGVR